MLQLTHLYLIAIRVSTRTHYWIYGVKNAVEDFLPQADNLAVVRDAGTYL
ncbi:hypothetical protein NVIE_0668 [Nitrososphaera viennensis EN76]|uniref:Uncharacterized protein n=1 Tax=Nitrososphaera viennensis EN76 TaxID=926571 RepID=A0A060HH25_9ARCH|nr:hypothetical protein NVIE_0668 [Nitrososphaera viennensis EN76]